MKNNEMTLRGLFQEDKYDYIYIPRIQRDYAQGRDNDEVNIIRENLLDDVAKMKPLSWGIIFGVSEERKFEDGTKRKCFIPVDGQQRLTTLYLLYLYGDKHHHLSFKYLDKFNYETRNTSKDFIRAIVENWDGESETVATLKDHIMNQGWFLSYWQLDPTVDAMLNMLNAIDYRFRDSIHVEVFRNLDHISFEFLDLENFKLNETLYLKMNSRGRKLSQFDRIKSELDKILPTQQNDSGRFDLYGDKYLNLTWPFAQKWRYCMDRKWSDLFWDKEQHSFDISFLSFLANYLIGCAGKDYAYADKLLAIDYKDSDFFLPWKYFEGVLGDYDQKYLEEIAAILNKLVSNREKGIVKELIAIADTFPKRAKQFGLLCFQGTDYTSAEFKEWKRFITNYATNTVNDKDSFFNFAKRIKDEFAHHSTAILTYLSSRYNPDKSDDRLQLSEEYFKAYIILQDRGQGSELEKKIKEAERHPLLAGRLRPLITDNNKFDIESFLSIWRHFIEWFGERGDALNFKEGDNESLNRRSKFARAFMTRLTQRNQLFDNHKILCFSDSGLRENLRYQYFEPVFRACLLSDNLFEVVELSWSNDNDIECIQAKKALLQPGVIEGILSRGKAEESRFQWYRNTLCLFPYNGKSTDNRIGFDRINDNPAWTRNRNQTLAYLIGESFNVLNKPVSKDKNVPLWWGNDIRFTFTDAGTSIQLMWNADYNIGIIHEDWTWIKRQHMEEGQNENFLFNAVGKSKEEIKDEIMKMINEYRDTMLKVAEPVIEQLSNEGSVN